MTTWPRRVGCSATGAMARVISMASHERNTRLRWITGVTLFCAATAVLLGLSHLFGWLSRLQIDWLAR